ncbi:MAG: HlyD family efflux transporter periplasmic adaptor subunit [Bryobacteraceae bacterium]|nr:HlyD family efflux transporter periplasmic adaptor subunit [Bryobacteraceae bacterium]
MQVHGRTTTLPGVPPEQPPRTPQLAPRPERRRGRHWAWLIIPLIVAAGTVIYLLTRPAGARPGAGAAAVAEIPTFVVDARPIEKTVRATGATQAERFASLLVPVLQGNRGGRGRDAQSMAGVQVNSTITVNSTSSVARSSTSSRLSDTGALSSSAGEGAQGVSGAPRAGSSAMRAATSRVGSGSASQGGSSGSSPGNVSAPRQTGATAMGATGLGSTSSGLRGGSQGPGAIGGGGGGGRRRGDFHLAVETLAPAGVYVKKGDIVAEFDRQFMLLRLEDYRSSVVQADAALKKARADLSVLREAHRQSIESSAGELDKAKFDVKAAPVLSAIDSERLKLALEEAAAAYRQLQSETEPFDVGQRAQLRVAALEVDEAKNELRRAEANVDKLVSKAPIDGMVVRMNVFRGGEFTQVREGDELWGGMPFLQIVDPSSMMIDAVVNQVDIEKVRIGQQATVRFDAFPELELPARVYAIGTVAKARQFRQEYVKEVPVKLKLEKMDPRVIPDLSVSADIVVAREERAVVAPMESVFRDDDGEPFVFLRTPSGWQRREIEIALANHVEVGVRTGLDPGQSVARVRPPRSGPSPK